MSTTLRVNNFDPLNIKETTRFGADAAAGVTSLTVESLQNLAVGNFAYLGDLGSELCEKALLSATSGSTSMTVSAGTSFAHKRFEKITAVNGDSLRIYRAANLNGTVPADTSFSLVSATIPIQPDQFYTDYVDVTGSSDFWYKFTYYHSINVTETSLSSAQAVRGADFGHYCTVEDIRAEAGFQKALAITDADIALRRDDAEGYVNGQIITSYSLPLSTPTPYLVRNITRMLAAGLLMTQQFGLTSNSTGVATAGQKKIDEAMKLLGLIDSHDLTIVDYTGTSLAVTSQVSGWPNSSTATYNDDNPSSADPIGGDRKFRMSKNF